MPRHRVSVHDLGSIFFPEAVVIIISSSIISIIIIILHLKLLISEKVYSKVWSNRVIV
jgi:hypothetical protein